MKVKEVGLCGNLKRMGFTQDSQMRLYGEEFELMSDPIVMADDVVFVDAIEKETGRSRRVRIPLRTFSSGRQHHRAGSLYCIP
jgi:CRISPR/Cas system CMR subunit Cmr4 (Cas7 group RAMP superfamily)